MTLGTSVEEIQKLRDRLLDQRAKAREVLSTTTRTIALGLSALVFTFLTSANASKFFDANKNYILFASLCGVLAFVLEFTQYFYDQKSAQETLNYLKANITDENTPTRIEIEQVKISSGGSIAVWCLMLKTIVTSLGLISVGIAVLSAFGTTNG